MVHFQTLFRLSLRVQFRDYYTCLSVHFYTGGEDAYIFNLVRYNSHFGTHVHVGQHTFYMGGKGCVINLCLGQGLSIIMAISLCACQNFNLSL